MNMSVQLLVGSLLALQPVAPAETHVVTVGSHRFTLPAGFEIELAAGPPLIDRPVHADFDDEGRLYVCESAGINDKVEQQLEERPHWIVCLEDTDGDGRFDRKTKFADRMMFPEGMLCLGGSIYVAAPPSIWKLTDTDGDGVADVREEWFQGKTLTGCANDLHGPYAGPDGWIYWCKGAFAEQTYERPGKPPLVTRAAHMFRCRPDGSGIEAVMTGGMDNPVEVAFTPGGERIFTTTFFQHPGGGQRDGLIHAIYGGVYGKPHDVLDGHPRTGDLMPPLAHLGAAAPSGLARYQSQAFGADYQDNLFAALFNMRKVTRHALTPAGATFASRDEDFVVSDNLDFHPTDVLEDADGSLLVIDTGGWYKLCCPTSQLWKPEILGGIYRVRGKDAPHLADPRGAKIDWQKQSAAQLAGLLADGRPAVAQRAIRLLGSAGQEAVAELTKILRSSPDPRARLHAVWALTRVDLPTARELVRTALHDSDETVRQAAIHSVSVSRDELAIDSLAMQLESGSPHNRRAAAEALGRLGNSAAVAQLLSAAATAEDRTLEHSVTYALIEIADPAATRAGLASSSPRTRRAALLALDQMPAGGIEPQAVADLLAGDDPLLATTAAWILERHAEWAEKLTPWLKDQLASGALSSARAETFAALLKQLAAAQSVQELLAARLQAESLDAAERLRILQLMSHSGLKKLPASWAGAFTQLVARDESLIGPVVAVVRAIPKQAGSAAELRAALSAAAANTRLPVGIRLEALAAASSDDEKLRPSVFDFVRGSLTSDEQLSTRLAAAQVLSKSWLDDDQLLALADNVRAAGPLEIENLLAPFAKSSNKQVGRAVIAALTDCAALTNVRSETLDELFRHAQPDVLEQSQALRKLQAAGATERMAKIEDLLGRVPQGDVQRGQIVFNSQKAACFTCHEIGYLGGHVGPDLTRIGQIRSERDLLEAIVFPSASFVRSYEPITVSTTGGLTHSGLLRKDAPDEVILAINAKDTVRIPRDEIDQMAPATVSVMPAGLDQQLSTQELVDLVAFLRACK